MSSRVLMISSSKMQIPIRIHSVLVLRNGSQASLRGIHCKTTTTVIVIHQSKQNINKISFTRLIFPVVKIDAYQVSIETLTSVKPHT